MDLFTFCHNYKKNQLVFYSFFSCEELLHKASFLTAEAFELLFGQLNLAVGRGQYLRNGGLLLIGGNHEFKISKIFNLNIG